MGSVGSFIQNQTANSPFNVNLFEITYSTSLAAGSAITTTAYTFSTYGNYSYVNTPYLFLNVINSPGVLPSKINVCAVSITNTQFELSLYNAGTASASSVTVQVMVIGY